jgi:hypothetical protein
MLAGWSRDRSVRWSGPSLPFVKLSARHRIQECDGAG